MNIAVIAANGRTGRAFVTTALAAGHSVRAGALTVNNFPKHQNLTEVICDATNVNDLSLLLEGQDAVASFIGHVRNSPPTVQTDAIRALVATMNEQNISRIVSLTGTGVRLEGDKITLIDQFLNLAVGIIDPNRVSDGKSHVKVLQESNLDWTVIRVLKLENVAPKPFQLLEHGPTKMYVSRDEVAQAALQVLDNASFVRLAPIISKAQA